MKEYQRDRRLLAGARVDRTWQARQHEAATLANGRPTRHGSMPRITSRKASEARAKSSYRANKIALRTAMNVVGKTLGPDDTVFHKAEWTDIFADMRPRLVAWPPDRTLVRGEAGQCCGIDAVSATARRR